MTFASDKYIKSLGFDPAKTTRMSKIQDNEYFLQTVIPPGLMNVKGGGLDLKVECHPTKRGIQRCYLR